MDLWSFSPGDNIAAAVIPLVHTGRMIDFGKFVRKQSCDRLELTASIRALVGHLFDAWPWNGSYFHLVFTLPHDLNPIILSNKRTTLNILFAAVNQTLQAFAKDPQWRLEGRLGFISVLHTWSQKLIDHFHLHCLIPAGALSFTKDKWIPAKDNFLFKITSLAKEFRKRYLKLLLNAYLKGKLIFTQKTAVFKTKQAFQQLINSVSKKNGSLMLSAPLPVPSKCLSILAATPTGWPYQTIASSQWITAG